MTGRARAEAVLSEADFQKRVTEYARLRGWRWVHIRNVHTGGGRWRVPYEGDGGLPDLVLARRGVVLLVELKADTPAPFQPGQEEWIDAAGGNGHVWMPRDWDRVLEILGSADTQPARPVAQPGRGATNACPPASGDGSRGGGACGRSEGAS